MAHSGLKRSEFTDLDLAAGALVRVGIKRLSGGLERTPGGAAGFCCLLAMHRAAVLLPEALVATVLCMFISPGK